MEQDKIPTAEDVIKKIGEGYVFSPIVKTLMIEFAKMHVKASLEAAANQNKISCSSKPGYSTYNEIVNSYPLENIK